MKIVLLTRSEARVEILRSIGFKVEVSPTDIVEVKSGDPVKVVRENAFRKFSVREDIEDLRAAFDTVIYLDGDLIGKPSDRDEAREFLMKLSGKWHTVHTGFVVGWRDKFVWGHEATKVLFRSLKDDDIEWYLSKGEYVGAAGGYRIQGYGIVLVERIEGDYTNVIGLPLRKFLEALESLGIDYRKII